VRSRDAGESAFVVSSVDLQEALRNLQLRAPAPVMVHGRSTARTVGHLKQDMLALLRRASPGQDTPPALADEHNDALDLVAMLYDNLYRDLKPTSTAATLLTKLQVPMMRVAIQDETFFTRQDHPARQMLNAIAETGASWSSEDEADPHLVSQMHSIVDRAVQEYRGDPGIFQAVLNELVGHQQTQARKAEVAERRHVEAAQGKERLTLARAQAVESIEALVKGSKLPRFTRTMLSQAWSDVLALTALRQGKDSQQWRQQMRVAERLVELAQLPRGSEGEDPDLVHEIEEGLSRVGYQADDVAAIARRLVHPNAGEEDDASSRTELTLRLKSQARLGEDNLQEKTKRTPLNSAEQAELARLQQLPTGHVFEFAQPKGDPVRLRLAWSSQATGALLFVNHRGQKNTDYTMDLVARLLARGQAKIIEEQKGSAIDRAWENVLGALRSFVVPEELGNPPA
jgi:hypothetical protein